LTEAIGVNTPVAWQVLQRDGSDQADIAITGWYSGSPTSIEARFAGGDWTEIDGSPSGGRFSGTLAGQSGQGTLEVRFANDTGKSTSVANVGIGDIFVVAGQSNAEGRATNSQSYSHATLKASVYTSSDKWG